MFGCLCWRMGLIITKYLPLPPVYYCAKYGICWFLFKKFTPWGHFPGTGMPKTFSCGPSVDWSWKFCHVSSKSSSLTQILYFGNFVVDSLSYDVVRSSGRNCLLLLWCFNVGCLIIFFWILTDNLCCRADIYCSHDNCVAKVVYCLWQFLTASLKLIEPFATS